jgi:hypothetical protein
VYAGWISASPTSTLWRASLCQLSNRSAACRKRKLEIGEQRLVPEIHRSRAENPELVEPAFTWRQKERHRNVKEWAEKGT